ncbi:MAG: PP2C family protein-serine/threonine phosphatase [Pseudomonadota bacterium]|uniref:PP2C family protein-serine/threonine phosphatase n=1 Tax=Roseovarius sp. TaxID=1486281 RepID=UPI00356956C2
MGESVETIEDIENSAQAIRRILVVDDSRVQRKIVSASLRRWGFSVTEADSAANALESCRTEPPDLVLSDWMMPGMTGLEFCREFRALPREDYGYFILLTSKSEKEEIARGLDAGADDFLTKPVNAAELRARIKAGDRILRMERELIDKNRLIASTLGELQKLYDSLDSDLIEARKLQQSLVSDRYRDLGVAEASLLLRSSGHVGGDLVGMFPVGQSRIGLYGIDVSGHGISSALMTARLAGYLSANAPDQNVALFRTAEGAYGMRPPADTIAALNRLILDEMDTEHYFTMVLADVDLARGEVILAQAGHPHPAVQRRNGKICMVGRGGLPVGLLRDAEYDQVKFHMAPGERLLIHSDGIVECADTQGRLLGDDGLETIMRDMRHTHGPAFLEALIWTLTEYAGVEDFKDDVSAVLLEFKPPLAGH